MAFNLMYPTQPSESRHPGPSRAGLPQPEPSRPEPQRVRRTNTHTFCCRTGSRRLGLINSG